MFSNKKGDIIVLSDPLYTSYEDIPVMMTVEEFGKLMRVSRNTAYAFVREGIVPTVKVGRQIRIYRGDVLKLRDVRDGKEQRAK